MRAVNLRMADAIRYMGQDSMRTYCAFLSEHFARRGVLLEPDHLLYLLYLLDRQDRRRRARLLRHALALRHRPLVISWRNSDTRCGRREPRAPPPLPLAPMVFPRLEVLYGDQVLHSLALPPAPRRAGQPPAAAAAAVAVWRNRTEEEEAEPDDEEEYEGDRERAAWERQAALERAAWDPNTTAHQLADLLSSASFASGSSPSAGLSSSAGGGANGTVAGEGASGADSYVPVVLANDLGTHGGARAGLSILYHGHALLLWGAPILMS